MSFILDALKKSETDRQRQSSPALFEVKVAAPRRGFPLWAVGLAALLGINILVLVWFLLRQPAHACGRCHACRHRRCRCARAPRMPRLRDPAPRPPP